MTYTFEPLQRAEVFSPDQLIAGSHPIVTDTVTLAAGQTLARGALIGLQSASFYTVAATAQTVSGGTNTGNGTIGSLSTGPMVIAGSYRVNFTSSTAFTVVDPEGEVLGTGSTGTAFTSPQVSFTVTAGGTAFAANDGFTLVIQEGAGGGSGYYVLATAAATDGSQLPGNWVILAEDADTSAAGTNAPTTVPVYVEGEFDAGYMTFGAGLSGPGVKEALRQAGSGLHIKTGAVINAIV